jgi:hypothetical protein
MEGRLIPYLICGYDGQDYITSYGKDQKTLFKSFLINYYLIIGKVKSIF